MFISVCNSLLWGWNHLESGGRLRSHIAGAASRASGGGHAQKWIGSYSTRVGAHDILYIERCCIQKCVYIPTYIIYNIFTYTCRCVFTYPHQELQSHLAFLASGSDPADAAAELYGEEKPDDQVSKVRFLE